MDLDVDASDHNYALIRKRPRQSEPHVFSDLRRIARRNSRHDGVTGPKLHDVDAVDLVDQLS